MLTLDRYFVRQVAVPMLGGLIVLILLFTAFNAANLLREAIGGQVASSDVLMLLTIRDVIALEVLLPTAFFLSVVLTVASSHRDREAYAAYASGTSPNRTVAGLWIAAVIVGLVVAFLSNVARPWAYQARYEISLRSAQLSVEAMQAGRYYAWQDRLVISAEDIDRGTAVLEQVFAHDRSGGIVNVVHSARGRIPEQEERGGQWFLFEDGTSYHLDATGRTDRTSRFSRLYFRASEAEQKTAATKRRARPTAFLAASDRPKEVAEFQWRMSLPLLAFLLAAIGIQLGRTAPGRTPYGRLALAVVVYAVVFNGAQVVRIGIENEQIAVFPGMYIVPVLVLIVAAVVSMMPRFSLARPQ